MDVIVCNSEVLFYTADESEDEKSESEDEGKEEEAESLVLVGKERWVEAVKACSTWSRMHVLLGMMDSCMKWEKSAEHAVSTTQTQLQTHHDISRFLGKISHPGMTFIDSCEGQLIMTEYLLVIGINIGNRSHYRFSSLSTTHRIFTPRRKYLTLTRVLK